ncbi:MAG TPA: hypothetical protein PKM43_21965, partial [Verrucomicrobiota bacterium]|nr:hypothetical protein [Verrucomicrobiota bacterium]
ARCVDTSWRLVIVVWAYLWIVLALWFTISPWRMRDLIGFLTASEQRIRMGSAARLAFGLLVLLLGLTAIRHSELQAAIP